MAKYPGSARPWKTVTAEEWRQKKAEQKRGKAVPLLLPQTGVTIMVTRPQISSWFGTKKLPERLSNNVVKVFHVETERDGSLSKQVEENIAALSEEENAELVGFFNRILMEGVVEPKLVDKEPEECGPDEMALSDLDEEERAFILFSFLEGLPSQSVPTSEGGEVSVGQLDRFRDQPGGPGAGEDGGEVYHSAVDSSGPEV